jgi:xanthine dehydrogenase YagR molybdenum-binding subunit
MNLKLGGGKGGTLDAVSLVSYGTPGIASGAGVAGPIQATYKVANVRTEETDVLTNTGPAAAMRAPGHPQGAFAYEQAIDMMAWKCGLDPLEYRRKIDRHPVRLAQYDVGAKEIGWARRAALAAANAKSPVKRGIGMGSAVWYNTGGAGATVIVRISKDGGVEVLNGAQDIGTGTRTLMAMVVAEELGVPMGSITVRLGRTEWPEGPASGGSTTVPTLMPAVRAAAFDAKKRLIAVAARALGVEEGTVSVETPGPVFRAGGGSGASLSFRQVAAKIPGEVLTAQGSRAENYEGFEDLIAGVQFAEVEVDTRTGTLRVVKVVAVQDCGRVINPLTAESQINGGVIQGLSFALFEERLLDPATGRMVNPNLEQYKIAGSLDIPEIVAIPFTVAAGSNNIGALGIGEPPAVPTAAAIANAFHHATGARLFELPMTPARVLAALGGHRA